MDDPYDTAGITQAAVLAALVDKVGIIGLKSVSFHRSGTIDTMVFREVPSPPATAVDEP